MYVSIQYISPIFGLFWRKFQTYYFISKNFCTISTIEGLQYFKHSQYHYHTSNSILLAIQISNHSPKFQFIPLILCFLKYGFMALYQDWVINLKPYQSIGHLCSLCMCISLFFSFLYLFVIYFLKSHIFSPAEFFP